MSEHNLNRKTKAALSRSTVKLALSKIILPSIGRVLWELKRQ